MGRPWRVVGADASQVGAGGTGGGWKRLWVPAADGVLPLSPNVFMVSLQLQGHWRLASVLGSMGILPEANAPRSSHGSSLLAWPHGRRQRSFRDRDPGEERIHSICWSWACVSHVRPLQPLSADGMMAARRALTQESGGGTCSQPWLAEGGVDEFSLGYTVKSLSQDKQKPAIVVGQLRPVGRSRCLWKNRLVAISVLLFPRFFS